MACFATVRAYLSDRHQPKSNDRRNLGMPRQYSNGGRDARRPSGPAAIGPPAAPAKSLKERVGALRNLRPFLTMVWHTSRGLTAASLVLRLVRAVMPVITLYVGKLIIDNVVLL